MKIEITGVPKEIAALVLELRERQAGTVNQLVLDTVNNASAMQSGSLGDRTLTNDNTVDGKGSIAND